MKIKFPSENKIIELNILILTLIKVKKADQAKVLSKVKILKILHNCEQEIGDIYDKAAVLMIGLVKEHPFASGNRRTAFIATKYFIKENNGKFNIKDNPEYAKVMLGIRENYYSHQEIKEWIKNGKIKAFKR